MQRVFRFTGPLPNLRPRYNVAPTQQVPIVRRAGERELAQVRWGLIPFWAKDEKIGYKLINARAEGIDAKPSFREAFKRGRRCLIPGRLLRVGEGHEAEAALAHHARGQRALRLRRPVGTVGEGARRRAGRELHDHHDGREPTPTLAPRPHAGDPRARRLCGMAGRGCGARRGRATAAIPVRGDADVPCQHGRQ